MFVWIRAVHTAKEKLGGNSMNFLKRLLNVFLIIVGILLIGFCADIVVNKTVNVDYDSFEEVDKTAVAQVAEMFALFDKDEGNDDVWDANYNLADDSVVVTRTYGMLKGRSYVIGGDLSGNIFAVKVDMPEDYSKVPVYRLSVLAPQTLSLFFSDEDLDKVQIDNEECTAIKFSKSTVNHTNSGSFAESVVKATFSSDIESPDQPSAEVRESFLLTEENIALTGLQYRIIDEIRAAEDMKVINELIAEYVAVREYQLEEYPELAAQQEKIELVDGRSQYVFYKMSEELGNDLTYFNMRKSEEIAFYSAYYYVCTGHYQYETKDYFNYYGNVYVGAVLCEIIEEKGLVAHWREKLDNSTNKDFISQYGLIKDYCDRACSQYSEKTLDEIKEEYNYEEILNMAKTLVNGDSNA